MCCLLSYFDAGLLQPVCNGPVNWNSSVSIQYNMDISQRTLCRQPFPAVCCSKLIHQHCGDHLIFQLLYSIFCYHLMTVLLSNSCWTELQFRWPISYLDAWGLRHNHVQSVGIVIGSKWLHRFDPSLRFFHIYQSICNSLEFCYTPTSRDAVNLMSGILCLGEAELWWLGSIGVRRPIQKSSKQHFPQHVYRVCFPSVNAGRHKYSSRYWIKYWRILTYTFNLWLLCLPTV